MYITLDELNNYLKTLEDNNYHGKINMGFFGGKITSVKLDASVDLEAIKSFSNKEADSDGKQTS